MVARGIVDDKKSSTTSGFVCQQPKEGYFSLSNFGAFGACDPGRSNDATQKCAV